MRNLKLYVILASISIVVVVGSLLLLTAGRVFGQFFFGRSFAEAELRDYVASVLKQEVNGSKCQAMDTDHNGYVSCDFTLVSQPNKPYTVECAAWGLDGFLNRGCKSRFPNY
jgi:hypothetical protein